MTNIYKEHNHRKAFIYMNEMSYFEGMDSGIDITLGTNDGNQIKRHSSGFITRHCAN